MNKYFYISSAVILTLLLPAATFADVTATAQSVTTASGTPLTIVLSGVADDGVTPLTFATTSDPAGGTLGTIGSDGSVLYTPNSGFSGSDSFDFVANEASSTGTIISPSASVSITVSAPVHVDTVTLKIYDDTTLATSSTVDLPAADAPDVTLTADDTSTHSAPARSAIAVLESADAASDTFDVTDMQYFNGLGFSVNCVQIPSIQSDPLCTLFPPSWLYAVNGTAPTVGMSTEILHDGDTLTLYYSSASSRRVVIKDTSVTVGVPFTAEAQELDPATGSYHATTGFTIDVGTPSGFSLSNVVSSTTDANGDALFTLNATGTYATALQEDFDFPMTNFTVNDALATSSDSGSSGGGGGGGGGSITHNNLNIPLALSYIASKQNADGSFSSSIITDWTAIAFAASDPGTAKTKLHDYLMTATPPMTVVADYERHAMALEALGINPYSGTSVDYVTPIIAKFNGTDIENSPADAGEDNDDIFAILALTHAGYTSSDTIIKKEAAFLLSKQKADGSWDESTDLTGAAIEALGPLFDIAGVNAGLGRAAGYLLSTQQGGGGWGNIDSTSWAQTAINGVILAHTPGFSLESAWASTGGFYPTDAIAAAQQTDGAVQPVGSPADTRTWSTSYAVVAASGKDWNSVLQSFGKPVNAGSSGGGVNGTATTTAATSTTATTATSTATTTPGTATSTVLVATSSATSDTTTPPAGHQPQTPPSKKTKSTTTEGAAIAGANTGTPKASSTLSTTTQREGQLAAPAAVASTHWWTVIGTAITHFFGSLGFWNW